MRADSLSIETQEAHVALHREKTNPGGKKLTCTVSAVIDGKLVCAVHLFSDDQEITGGATESTFDHEFGEPVGVPSLTVCHLVLAHFMHCVMEDKQHHSKRFFEQLCETTWGFVTKADWAEAAGCENAFMIITFGDFSMSDAGWFDFLASGLQEAMGYIAANVKKTRFAAENMDMDKAILTPFPHESDRERAQSRRDAFYELTMGDNTHLNRLVEALRTTVQAIPDNPENERITVYANFMRSVSWRVEITAQSDPSGFELGQVMEDYSEGRLETYDLQSPVDLLEEMYTDRKTGKPLALYTGHNTFLLCGNRCELLATEASDLLKTARARCRHDKVCLDAWSAMSFINDLVSKVHGWRKDCSHAESLVFVGTWSLAYGLDSMSARDMFGVTPHRLFESQAGGLQAVDFCATSDVDAGLRALFSRKVRKMHEPFWFRTTGPRIGILFASHHFAPGSPWPLTLFSDYSRLASEWNEAVTSAPFFEGLEGNRDNDILFGLEKFMRQFVDTVDTIQ